MDSTHTTALPENGANRILSGWGLATIFLIVIVVTWTGVQRFLDPVRDKYVTPMPPGSADFFFPFGGARALVAGENPYVNDLPGLDDPWKRGFGIINGKQYRGLYPPTHFLLYVPLTLITDDWREAGRILFMINLAAFYTLAIVTWWLLVRIGRLSGEEGRWSMFLIPLIFVILACNVGGSYALDRGDGGDVLAAVFCWTAVVLALENRWGLAMFLMVPAMFIKGYPLLCGLGLGLLGLTRRTWVQTVSGTVIGLAVFLLPVARYIPDGLTVTMGYPGFPGDWIWWNHSFWNVFHQLMPEWIEPGRWLMAGYCTLLSIACWVKTRCVLRTGEKSEGTFWLVMFAMCATEVILGNARVSMVYNLILVVPGILIFILTGPYMLRVCGSPKWMVHLVGGLNFIAAFLLFKFVLLDMAGFPSPGIAVMLFLLATGILVVGYAYRARVRPFSLSSAGSPA